MNLIPLITEAYVSATACSKSYVVHLITFIPIKIDSYLSSWLQAFVAGLGQDTHSFLLAFESQSAATSIGVKEHEENQSIYLKILAEN